MGRGLSTRDILKVLVTALLLTTSVAAVVEAFDREVRARRAAEDALARCLHENETGGPGLSRAREMYARHE